MYIIYKHKYKPYVLYMGLFLKDSFVYVTTANNFR